MTNLLRRACILSLGLSALTLNSCGMARSLIQIPGRTIQSVGRTVGFGLESSEIVTDEKLTPQSR